MQRQNTKAKYKGKNTKAGIQRQIQRRNTKENTKAKCKGKKQRQKINE